jgi:ribonuclease HII
MIRNSLNHGIPEAGCDEAGRGCLAGPVVAAAVILPPGYRNTLINDSKKLQVPLRNSLRTEIENNSLAWAIGVADNNEIDKINILQASILAMHRALEALVLQPGHILVDGNYFKPFRSIPHTCVVRGDSLYMNIAAASILAKTHRDEIMLNLHNEYPGFGWDQNKGYPTRFHIRALQQCGPSLLHRKSFRLVMPGPELDFPNMQPGIMPQVDEV